MSIWTHCALPLLLRGEAVVGTEVRDERRTADCHLPPAPATTVGGGLERGGHHVTRAAMVVPAIADHIPSGGDGDKLDCSVYRLALQQGQTVSFPHSL
jgi:hypothetical protein